MPVFDLDLTGVDVVKDGTFVATITKAEVKSAKDGLSEYINWSFFIPEQNCYVFHITSLKAAALFGLKNLLLAAGVPITSTGFSTDEAIGKQVNVTLATVEAPAYGMQTKVTKITKV